MIANNVVTITLQTPEDKALLAPLAGISASIIANTLAVFKNCIHSVILQRLQTKWLGSRDSGLTPNKSMHHVSNVHLLEIYWHGSSSCCSMASHPVQMCA
jgi:hypothetical protein